MRIRLPGMSNTEPKTLLRLYQRIRVVPQARPERLPLSYVQQRLWFVHRLEGSHAVYNIPVAGRMKGELDPRALERALWDLFHRHESLRTIFPDHDGVPCQRVLPAEMARPRLPVEPLTEEGLHERLDAIVADCRIQLEEELPLKAWLFRLGPDDHVLLFIMHHIAADGWSLARPGRGSWPHAWDASKQKAIPTIAPPPAARCPSPRRHIDLGGA